jgi:hypothetical protein
MEELLKLVQLVDEKCNDAEEKTNDQERDHLEAKLLVIWKKLGSVMHPVMELDDELLPIYNEFSEISKELDILNRREGEAMNIDQRQFTQTPKLHPTPQLLLVKLFAPHCWPIVID